MLNCIRHGMEQGPAYLVVAYRPYVCTCKISLVYYCGTRELAVKEMGSILGTTPDLCGTLASELI